MASTVGSTAASVADRVRQGGVDLCVTMMIQLILFDPWITEEEMVNYLTWIGPEGNTSRLMRMFGGRTVFRRTLQRMGVIRQARIQGKLHELHITTEPSLGTIPEIEDKIHLWAPRVTGGEPLFGHPSPEENLPNEPLYRYPREGTYSDDFWEEDEAETEESMAETEQLMESDEEGSDDFNMARPEANT